ncbi:MAG: hypothetical protein GXY61_14370 [Lentisphaerae bacterium]|jgi:hypothetical protein|nr:hypothetical protein [Lentisphaerota bacterium]
MLDAQLMELLSQRLAAAAERVRGVRSNETLSDLDFALAGICRVLSKSRSGREWLQCDELFDIARSTFFDALKSTRRGNVIGELARCFTADLAEVMKMGGVDFISDIPKLADVEVIAVDGHEIEHPQHAAKNEKGKFTSVKTIYQM